MGPEINGITTKRIKIHNGKIIADAVVAIVDFFINEFAMESHDKGEKRCQHNQADSKTNPHLKYSNV